MGALPPSTRLLARVHPKRLRMLDRHPLMANTIRTGICTLVGRATRGLADDVAGDCGKATNRALGALKGEGLANLDPSRRALVAVATTGLDETLRRLRWGLPRSEGTPPPAAHLHVRLVLPTSSPDELTADVRDFCSQSAAPCPDDLRMEPLPDGKWLRLDLPVDGGGELPESLSSALEQTVDERPELLTRKTSARRAFFDDDPVVTIYTRLRGLADIAATEALARAASGAPDDERSDSDRALDRFEMAHRSGAPYALFRPKSMEYEDATMRMGGGESDAWAEWVLTPTTRGESFAEFVPGAEQPDVPTIEGADVRARWNVDMPRLYASVLEPNWGSRRRAAFLLGQSGLGVLQFAGYPFAQSRVGWAWTRARYQNQPLVRAANPFFRSRFVAADVRLNSDSDASWSMGIAGIFPHSTWSNPRIDQLRRLVTSSAGSGASVSVERIDTTQQLRITGGAASDDTFQTDDTLAHPLEIDVEEVDDFSMGNASLRTLLAAAPLELRGRLDGEATVVRLAAGADAPSTPIDPDSEVERWKPTGTWSNCLIPVFEARHAALRQLRSAAPDRRGNVWEKTSARILGRFDDCPENDRTKRAREKWRNARQTLRNSFQSE